MNPRVRAWGALRSGFQALVGAARRLWWSLARTWADLRELEELRFLFQHLPPRGLSARAAWASSKTSPWRYFPILVVTLVGTLISYYAYLAVTDWEHNQVKNTFAQAAQDRVLVVRRELQYTLALVQDIANFIESSPQVGRREFRKFVNPALQRQPAIHALAWVPLVGEAGLKDFVNEARRSFSPYQVVERDDAGRLVRAQSREEHFPVLYVQPYKFNKDLLGLDLAAEPDALAAIKQARAPGGLHVRFPVPVSRDGRETPGFMVYVPVYSKKEGLEVSGENEEEGDAPPGEFRGVVMGLFCVEEIVERALANLRPAGIEMRFHGLISETASVLLHLHPSRLGPPLPFPREASGDEDLHVVHALTVGDRTWRVFLAAEPGHYRMDSWKGILVIGEGLAFTLLLAIYIWTLVNRAEKVRRLVGKRTAQLERAVTALNKEILERKRAESKLQGLNENLESIVARRTLEAERRANELEQFAYVASHDLKAPLRAISNLASWIEEDLMGKLDHATQEQMMLLRDRVQRMHALIEGLLEYSRVGRTEDSDVEIDSGELLAKVVDSLSPPKGFTVHVPPDMPVFRGDRLQLGQVFSNLIGNSLKHHGGKTGRVWITARDLGPSFEFCVADDGQGIASAYHDRIFMMFQTLETRDTASSTGIGLALVKKIVQEQGGAIRLESEEGAGAKFIFTWPKRA